MADSKVWASTAAIDAILRPESSHSKGHRKKAHVRGSFDTVDWGWTFASVTDWALDGKAGVTIAVDDPESEFNRREVVLPACALPGARPLNGARACLIRRVPYQAHAPYKVRARLIRRARLLRRARAL